MKKTFMMPVVCSLLAASMMLSGCSAVSNGDNAVGETSKPTEIKSIGLMVQDMSNPFFSAMDREAKVQAKKIGATLNVQDAQLDLTTQDNQISAFIEQGVDLIIVSAVDESGLKPAIERARAAGIIVVAVDTPAKGADAIVMTDGVQAGELSCEYLANQLGARAISSSSMAPLSRPLRIELRDVRWRLRSILISRWLGSRLPRTIEPQVFL